VSFFAFFKPFFTFSPFYIGFAQNLITTTPHTTRTNHAPNTNLTFALHLQYKNITAFLQHYYTQIFNILHNRQASYELPQNTTQTERRNISHKKLYFVGVFSRFDDISSPYNIAYVLLFFYFPFSIIARF